MQLILEDHEIEYHGERFCALELYRRHGVTFAQYLVAPERYAAICNGRVLAAHHIVNRKEVAPS